MASIVSPYVVFGGEVNVGGFVCVFITVITVDFTSYARRHTGRGRLGILS